MSFRFLAPTALIGCLVAGWTASAVAQGQHPLTSSDGKSWQIEFDNDHPRRGIHAARLIINEPTGSGAKVEVSGTLYLFGAPQGGPNKKYEPRGSVPVAGTVDRAQSTGQGGNQTHWKKAGLDVDLYGVRTEVDQGKVKTYLVRVRGTYHPGRNNKKQDVVDPRADDRFTFFIVQKELGAAEGIQTGVAQPAADPTQQAAEASRSEENLRLLLQKLFDRFSGTVPCDDAPPSDAAEETPLEDATNPMDFAYAPAP